MIKSIEISFCESNGKYDMTINGRYKGKYYSMLELLGSIMREMSMIDWEKQKSERS